MDRLAGKIAIITGASAGIGRASAELFAAEGASVALIDIDEAGGREVEAAIAERGGSAYCLTADVSDAEGR